MKRSINPLHLILTAVLIIISFGIFILLAVRKNLDATQPQGNIALYTPKPSAAQQDNNVPDMAMPLSTVLGSLKKADLQLEEEDALGHNAFRIMNDAETKPGATVQFDVSEGYVTGFTLTLPAIARYNAKNPASEIEQYLFRRAEEEQTFRNKEVARLLPLLFDAVAGSDALPYGIEQQWIDDIPTSADDPDSSARHEGFTFLAFENREHELQVSLILP